MSQAPDAGAPTVPLPLQGAGGSPHEAAHLFSGLYDSRAPDGGTPDGGTPPPTASGGSLELPGFGVGGVQGFKVPIPMLTRGLETAHDNGPAHDSKMFERDTQKPEIRDDGARDKKIDPIGDMLKPPPGPDMSPAARKADYAIQHPQKPDAGVAPGDIPGVHKKLGP